MAIETTANRISYAGNGVTTGFAFPYKFLANADLVVISRNDTTGVETLKTLTTHYTVTGAESDSGGTVTMLVAPATGETLIIYNDPAATQSVDLRENDSLPAEVVERVFDRLTIMVQRLKDRVNRTVRLSDGFSPTFDPTLPIDLDDSGGKIPRINDAGTGFAAVSTWPDATGITAAMQAVLDAAEDARDAAQLAETNAETAEANAETAETNAETAETNAETAETNAAASAAAAAASALAAQNAAAANLWRDVVFITFADSPRTIVNADRNKLFAVDTSGGNVVLNLPAIAGLDLATPFALGVKKTSADGNNITINRASTDTIDGDTSKTISVALGGTTLIPDTDPSPDRWTSADFGASAGNLTRDKFSGTGSQTAYTLSVDPGSKNNTFIYVEGVYQAKDTYTLVGTALTFTEAPPLGTDNIEVMIGTLLSIGTPSDGTVTPAKMASRSSAAKTSAYTLTDADDYIEANTAGGAFAITLHDPATAKKKPYYIEYTNPNTSNLNALTITGTVEGVSGNSLNTKGEVLTLFPNGTEWKILNRKIPSAWVAYTPTFTGIGTPSAVSIFSKRDGDSLLIRGNFTTGTCTAATARMTLGFNGVDGGVALDTAKLPTSNSSAGGFLQNTSTTAYDWTVLAVPANTDRVSFGYGNNSQNSMAEVLANAMFVNSTIYSLKEIKVPISGWKA